jgi:NifU-like protein involved in Fe-S cluster formation
MQLDNLYQEVILDHYKNPQNKKLSRLTTHRFITLILHVAMKLI